MALTEVKPDQKKQTEKKAGPRTAAAKKKTAEKTTPETAPETTAETDAPTDAPEPETKDSAEPIVEEPTDADVTDVTGKKNAAVESTSTRQSPLKPNVEKKVDAAVTEVVPETNEWHKHAIRYGRKIAKKKLGLRASNPPYSGLSKETAAKVADAVNAAV